jgi:hypothetical protein
MSIISFNFNMNFKIYYFLILHTKIKNHDKINFIPMYLKLSSLISQKDNTYRKKNVI